jgi:hypothetical protein
MNDLRKTLLWLATLLVLAIGVWGFQMDETSAARPFAPHNRAFRAEHRVVLFGHEFALPLRGMFLGWIAVVLGTLLLWPLATAERSRRVFGKWSRPAPGLDDREEGGA